MMLSWTRMVRNGQNQVELIGLLMDWMWIMQEKRENQKVIDKGRVNFQGRIKVAWGKGNWRILNATSVPCSSSEPLPTTASRYGIICRKEVRRPAVVWVLSTSPAWFPSILPVPTPTKHGLFCQHGSAYSSCMPASLTSFCLLHRQLPLPGVHPFIQ